MLRAAAEATTNVKMASASPMSAPTRIPEPGMDNQFSFTSVKFDPAPELDAAPGISRSGRTPYPHITIKGDLRFVDPKSLDLGLSR